jgi:hypothetical protein
MPDHFETGEEVEFKARKAALRLLIMVGGEIQLMGVGASRHSNPTLRARADALVTEVMAQGGKTGAKTDGTSRFLADLSRWISAMDVDRGMSSAVKTEQEAIALARERVFPVTSEDVRAFVAWLRAQDQIVQAQLDRIDASCALLAALGCRVKVEPGLAAGAPIRTAALGGGTQARPNAREPTPPLAIVLLEGWVFNAVREPHGGCVCPHSDYVTQEANRFWSGQRFGDFHDSRFLTRTEVSAAASGLPNGLPADIVVSVCKEDKHRRVDVLTFVPAGAWTLHNDLAWRTTDAHGVGVIVKFAAYYAVRRHMHTDYVDRTTRQARGAVINEPCSWLIDGTGPTRRYRAAADSRARKAVGIMFSQATGIPPSELAATNLSGTHKDRHVPAVVAELAGWTKSDEGTRQADILGDWTTPGGKKASRRTSYIPNSSLKEQVEARTRYLRLMQAAFARFNVDKKPESDKPDITDRTTWRDLTPEDPPNAEMAPYYGKPVREERPDVPVDAKLVGVTFAPPIALGKRKKRAP